MLELGNVNGVSDKPKSFGKYIEQRRTLKRYSVADAAKQMCMRPLDLEMIEKNGVNKRTHIGTINKIVTFYNIPAMMAWNLINGDLNRG